MQVRWLFLVGVLGCSQEFQAADLSTLPDAATEASEVDTTPASPRAPDAGSADMFAEGDAPGSVEASDVKLADQVSADSTPDALDSDHRDDAWPDDVVVVPWCPESEFFPTYSVTCEKWGVSQGWTLQGCCLPDHTCGTVQNAGSVRVCRK